jgi:hypothetical protein
MLTAIETGSAGWFSAGVVFDVGSAIAQTLFSGIEGT